MPRFIPHQDIQHSQTSKVGILVTNLGTPDAPTSSALRRYLREFLWDRRVVEIPRAIWWFMLNFLVLPTRPKQSAKAYQKVWTKEGSPLLTNSLKQVEKLRQQFPDAQVELAMRYGNPSIESGLKKLKSANVNRLLIFPLYPQYTSSTVGSTFEAISAELNKWRLIPDLRFISQYHAHPAYITAMADHIQDHWKQHGQAELLIFSFHGIPTFHIDQGDPYLHHCKVTAEKIIQALDLKPEQWKLTFQSRFGKAEWLQPYTDKTMKDLPSQGIKSLDIFCPGFPSDCLETLEEIAEENKEYFMQAGGEKFSYIPALNDTEDHIQALSDIIKQQTSDWH